MKLYELLKSYKEKSEIKAIVHIDDEKSFTIYSDAVDYLDSEINQTKVIDWTIKGRNTIEVWLEKAIPSG